ncbi:MAG: DUF2187 domain-containing protein [Aerococcus sp.]|nr:DUF2187 domain-containing protein [Aerococcus sp.]
MNNQSKSKVKLTAKTQALVESELRRGTSKSRIATLLDVPYDEAVTVIKRVKESVRPDIGDEVRFQFRRYTIVGRIEKLLNNSAVVWIYWNYSDRAMSDVLDERTVVNFKDIQEFVQIAAKQA